MPALNSVLYSLLALLIPSSLAPTPYPHRELAHRLRTLGFYIPSQPRSQELPKFVPADHKKSLPQNFRGRRVFLPRYVVTADFMQSNDSLVYYELKVPFHVILEYPTWRVRHLLFRQLSKIIPMAGDLVPFQLRSKIYHISHFLKEIDWAR